MKKVYLLLFTFLIFPCEGKKKECVLIHNSGRCVTCEDPFFPIRSEEGCEKLCQSKHAVYMGGSLNVENYFCADKDLDVYELNDMLDTEFNLNIVDDFRLAIDTEEEQKKCIQDKNNFLYTSDIQFHIFCAKKCPKESPLIDHDGMCHKCSADYIIFSGTHENMCMGERCTLEKYYSVKCPNDLSILDANCCSQCNGEYDYNLDKCLKK